MHALMSRYNLFFRFDDHLCDHLRVQRTEVWKRSWLIESEREALVSIKRLRFELLLSADDSMWNIVMVDPGHFGSGRDGQGRRHKAEVIDFDSDPVFRVRFGGAAGNIVGAGCGTASGNKQPD